MARLRKPRVYGSTDQEIMGFDGGGLDGPPLTPPYIPPAVPATVKPFGVVPPQGSQQDPTNPPPVVPPPPGQDNVPNGPEPGPNNTQLMEGDPGKLADPKHALKSPKYSFLQLAKQGKYGYNELDKMLAELQQSYGDFWGGWTAAGDKLRYTGDPAQLHSAWDGVTEVDAIGAFNSGNPQGWRWGVNSPGGAGMPSPVGGAGQAAGVTPQAPPPRPPTLRTPPLKDTFRDAGQEFGPEGGAGVYPDDPLQQVGDDPFSELITGGLAALINSGGEGFSRTGKDANEALSSLLRGGRGGFNEGIVNARMESARENAERWRKGQVDTLRAGLADRGLLGSGPERTGLERIGMDMAGVGATALRDIFADESGAADERYMDALQLGLAGGQANNQALLSGLSQAHGRQMGLSQIALQSLAQNMEWNKFLAEFGLDRDQVMEEMQSGRLEALLPLLQLFIQLTGQSQRGYV